MSAQIILASASPRRKALLAQIGVLCLVHPVDLDETPFPDEPALAYVRRLAAEKSAACASRVDSLLPILAADTTVALGGMILGKPNNVAEAKSMLRRLSGQTHQVYTAVSLRGKRHGQAHSVTDVRFRPLSEREIAAYCQTEEPMDKAGSYALQGKASIFVASIHGSFSGVVGLPLFETARLLSAEGISVLA